MSVLLKPWLRRWPQPVTVLCDETKLQVPKGNKAWSELARSVEALNPARVQCLAADGTVIRALSLTDGTDATEPDQGDSQEQADLKLFARLLAEAYDKGSKGSQPLLDKAMEFIERQAARLARTEAELERAYAHIHKLQAELLEATAQPPEAEGSVEERLVGAFMQGRALAESNGKPPTKAPAQKAEAKS